MKKLTEDESQIFLVFLSPGPLVLVSWLLLLLLLEWIQCCWVQEAGHHHLSPRSWHSAESQTVHWTCPRAWLALEQEFRNNFDQSCPDTPDTEDLCQWTVYTSHTTQSRRTHSDWSKENHCYIKIKNFFQPWLPLTTARGSWWEGVRRVDHCWCWDGSWCRLWTHLQPPTASSDTDTGGQSGRGRGPARCWSLCWRGTPPASDHNPDHPHSGGSVDETRDTSYAATDHKQCAEKNISN